MAHLSDLRMHVVIVHFLFLFVHFSDFSLGSISVHAVVSEFNDRCFLCSWCSMEMWCPDETGWATN